MKPLICITLLTFWCVQASETSKAWTVWVLQGRVLMAAGRYSDAARALRRAVVTAESSYADNQTMAEIYDTLALVYAEAGQYVESERQYRRALDIVEKSHGRQSLEYAVLTANLALLPTRTENRDPLIVILRQAIAVNRRSGPALKLAIVRECLAQILMDGRRYAEAETVLLDEQADFARLREASTKKVAEVLNTLGSLRFNQGRYEESTELRRESLGLLKNELGDEHPSLIVPLSNLALSYIKLGRFDDAEPTLERAFRLCNKTLGEDHPTCGGVLGNYAAVLRKLGHKREAKALAARSRQIARAFRRRNGLDSIVSVIALRPDKN